MTTAASLASLLKNLSISNDEPDHEQILRHADGVLKTDKTNELAQRTKVVALLQLDRFDDAVKFLDSNDVPNALLEKAYALYKVGRTDEVSTLAAQQVASSFVQRGLKHVEAQAVS
jgi:signal recognition particle subunit SRP72